MATLAELMVKVGVSTQDFTKGMTSMAKDVEKQVSTMEKRFAAFDKIGDRLTGIGKAMSMTFTVPVLAAGAAAFKFAADLEDAMGAADQIFKGQSGEIKAWADNLENYYGIAESEALSYANTMGAMLQNIGGLSEAEAAKMSGTLVELAGDLTAMFGGTTESAVQALTGALKGNNSMLDNYGMGVNEATIKSKALAMGLIAEGEQLDLAGKQAATLALIMEQTADAQGQAAREAEGASGSMRGLMAELKNVATEFGEVLLPILTPFVAKIKELTEKFGALSPETKSLIVTIAGIAAAVGPLLIIFGTLVSSISTIAGVFVLLTGPIGLVIAAIAAAIAIGVLLYKNWDTISAEARKFAENAKEVGRWIKDGFISAFNAVVDAGKRFISSLWEGIKSVFFALLKGGIIGLVNDFILKPFFGIDLFAAGKQIIQGLWNGILNMGSTFKKNLARWIDEHIPQVVKKILGIASPSKIMEEFGRMVAEGLALGIKENAGKVYSATKLLSDNIINVADAMTGRLSAAVTRIDKEFKLWSLTAGVTATETERLAAEKGKLTNQLSIAADNIQLYEVALAKALESEGENSEAVITLKDKLLDARIAYLETADAIRGMNVQMEEQIQKAFEATDTMEKWQSSMAKIGGSGMIIPAFNPDTGPGGGGGSSKSKTGFAYQDTSGFMHVVSDMSTALEYAAGAVREYTGNFASGYAHTAEGNRIKQVDLPGIAASKLSTMPLAGKGAIIPAYASGGIVSGPIGRPQLAVVHGGETVTPPGKQGAGDIHVHFHGPVYGMLDFEQMVVQIVRDKGLGGGFRGVFVRG
jgi:hypothetical protein